MIYKYLLGILITSTHTYLFFNASDRNEIKTFYDRSTFSNFTIKRLRYQKIYHPVRQIVETSKYESNKS